MVLRRMMGINEATGIMLESTDKTKEVDDRSLQETNLDASVLLERRIYLQDAWCNQAIFSEEYFRFSRQWRQLTPAYEHLCSPGMIFVS